MEHNCHGTESLFQPASFSSYSLTLLLLLLLITHRYQVQVQDTLSRTSDKAMQHCRTHLYGRTATRDCLTYKTSDILAIATSKHH